MGFVSARGWSIIIHLTNNRVPICPNTYILTLLWMCTWALQARWTDCKLPNLQTMLIAVDCMHVVEKRKMQQKTHINDRELHALCTINMCGRGAPLTLESVVSPAVQDPAGEGGGPNGSLFINWPGGDFKLRCSGFPIHLVMVAQWLTSWDQNIVDRMRVVVI
jgi:hypothetical protein